MEKLIQNKLRFGGLFRVQQDHLVARYNAALEEISGRRTQLAEFDIDAMGYSPQVADELGDDDYLDRHGINPHFIILSTKQRHLPVVRGWFSSYEGIMDAFWEANHDSLFALTTLTAVFGMIQNNTYRVTAPEELMAINTVRFEVETPDDLIDTAARLEANIETFIGNGDAWLDDQLVEEMCAQARLVGDIRRQPLIPSKLVFEKGHFYTQHFGGLYVLRIEGGFTVFSLDPAFEAPKKVNSSKVRHFCIVDEEVVQKFLRDNKLIDQVGDTHARDRATDQELDFLKMRRDLIVAVHMAENGALESPGQLEESDLRRYLVEHIEQLPDIVQSLVFAIKQIEAGRRFWVWDVPRDHRSYFLRAKAGSYAELIDQLLSHYCELDPLFLFATNKDLFYRLYEGWSAEKKALVVHHVRHHWLERRERTAGILFAR